MGDAKCPSCGCVLPVHSLACRRGGDMSPVPVKDSNGS